MALKRSRQEQPEEEPQVKREKDSHGREALVTVPLDLDERMGVFYGKVDLVFNSHTIVYERSHPLRNDRIDMDSGTTYIVAGGAGARPNWLHHKRAWHTAQSLAVPHFVQVIIAGTAMNLNVIDCEGRTFDTLTLKK